MNLSTPPIGYGFKPASTLKPRFSSQPRPLGVFDAANSPEETRQRVLARLKHLQKSRGPLPLPERLEKEYLMGLWWSEVMTHQPALHFRPPVQKGRPVRLALRVHDDVSGQSVPAQLTHERNDRGIDILRLYIENYALGKAYYDRSGSASGEWGDQEPKDYTRLYSVNAGINTESIYQALQRGVSILRP